MKKLLFLVVSMFVLNSTVLADGVSIPIDFNITNKSYAEITKAHNTRFIFDYNNNILNETPNLVNILSQKLSYSPLTYYEELKMKVSPIGDYEILKDKDLYLSYSSNWTNNDSTTSEMSDSATKVSKEETFYIYGFDILFRKNENDEYTNVIPNGLDLTNKSLEEQLATLLDIDLSSNSNGVIDAYNSLWKINVSNNKHLTYRFDFFTLKTDSELIEGSSSEYKTNTLNKLGTEYVVINYENGNTSTTFNLDETITNNNYISYIFIGVLVITIGVYFYLKRANI